MKLVTFTHGGETRIGAFTERGIVDFAAAEPQLPRRMLDLIAGGEAALALARRAAAGARAVIAAADVRLEAPVPDPGKILAIGLNYADHIAESKMGTPEHQIWFNKQRTAINGPRGGIAKPVASDALDYEAELCYVISRRCRHVPRERAHEVIFGYMAGNDVSVRDWQRRTPTMTMGKSFDTHAPTGPVLLTADAIGDPHDLGISCWVNGELRQNSNTKHLVFDCFDQIAHLTRAFTLEPGDIIFTGTPAGVGAAMTPPRFLKVGDVVKVEIDRIGALENEVVMEDGTPRIV